MFRISRAGLCQLLSGSLLFLFFSASCVQVDAAQVARGQDNRASEADRFVNDLLSRMTLEEKIGQMSQIALELSRGTQTR